jgi:excisionase family DNA binding protein
MQEPEAFVPINRLAEHLHVKVSTVRQWIKLGHIPRRAYLKIGNTYRFQVSEVLQALKTREAMEDTPVSAADTDPNMPVQLEFNFDTDETKDL